MINIALTTFAAEEAEASGFSALGFDPKAFLIQLVTFLLVFYILKRFVFGRIAEMLEKRRIEIEKGVTLTAQMNEEKAKLDKELSKIKADARKEAESIVADTHQQASQMIKDAETAAQERAERIVADAHKKTEDEVARARRNLEKEMVDLVIEATEKVTQQKLDAKKDNTLIANALKGQN